MSHEKLRTNAKQQVAESFEKLSISHAEHALDDVLQDQLALLPVRISKEKKKKRFRIRT
jgi:hypothetical protein